MKSCCELACRSFHTSMSSSGRYLIDLDKDVCSLDCEEHAVALKQVLQALEAA